MALLLACEVQALPIYAKQTGQKCASCHAGGQYPELTQFGRLFKLSGYTLGQRSDIPLALMGLASYSKVNKTNSANPAVDFAKDGTALFQTGSLLAGGKITDNVGAFVQITYDNYDSQNPDTLKWSGHTHADNIDVRYADRFSSEGNDLMWGLSLNNNPSVADVWNTAPAWQQYVPTAFGFSGPAAGPMIAQLGQQVAGIGVYGFWNNLIYAELSSYQTAKGVFSFLKQGNTIDSRLQGANPYLRLAVNHDWDSNSIMFGAFAMNANVYADALNTASPTVRYQDRGIDAQYQYLAEPHTITAQMSFIQEHMTGGDVAGNATNSKNNLNQFRAKASYIYQANYGGSLSYFRTSGSADASLYPGLQDDGTGAMTATPISGSANNRPDTAGWIPEVFWIPTQNLRVGVQYYKFNRFNGASNNYDGAGRNAHDNNTVFAYAWTAF
jgi:hypothetical protein